VTGRAEQHAGSSGTEPWPSPARPSVRLRQGSRVPGAEHRAPRGLSVAGRSRGAKCLARHVRGTAPGLGAAPADGVLEGGVPGNL